MRLAVYGTVSTLAASGVVLSAFAQRANFYAATVYLAQSNACLMILTNFSLLVSLLVAHIIQRILYGPLRDLEVESLYEKAWYAVTETCLAMTIFRDEWNVGFVLCFAGLLFAKGFCWLSAGRVEMMEQTPPANPQLFHARLVSSLILLIASDIAMVYYAVSNVLEAGKPNMMVMFAFEFTILLITALSTAGRYGLSITEKVIVQKQISARRLARQAERAAVAQRPEVNPEDQQRREDEEDEEDLELVWEEKGTWMFYLELATDFLKLLTYLAFFFIVLTFYGLPLHIIRDVYLTLRSFISRIRDFVRYRRATNDMNARYPDATEEEVERENVCIICREEMRPYVPPEDNPGAPALPESQQRQRMRPKKLPCGHILHFACLRSWLERQQRCPTCRRPVLDSNNNAANANGAQQPGDQNGRRGAAGAGGGGIAWGGQFGGIRVNFGVGQGPDFMQNLVNQWENRPNAGGVAAAPQEQQNQQGQQQGNGTPQAGPGAVPQGQNAHGQQPHAGISNLRQLHIQLQTLEGRLRRELEMVEAVGATVGEARTLRARLNQLHQQPPPTVGQNGGSSATTMPATPTTTEALQAPPPLQTPQAGATPTTTPHPNLPPALQRLNLPHGWQVIPLNAVAVNTTSTTSTTITGSAPVHGLSREATARALPPPQPFPFPEFPADGPFASSLADLRRRRFGRGDVRNYSANLRDYHAVRSPATEHTEAEVGLGSSSTLAEHPSESDTHSGATGETELQRRFREVVEDNLALDASTALMNSAARELGTTPDHHNFVPLPESAGSEEAIVQAERDLVVAYEGQRALIGLVERVLGEARQALGDRRTGSHDLTVPAEVAAESEQQPLQQAPETPPTLASTPAITPTGSSSQTLMAVNDETPLFSATVAEPPRQTSVVENDPIPLLSAAGSSVLMPAATNDQSTGLLPASSSSEEDQNEDDTGGSPHERGKGKGRAATVEDADDEE